MLISDSGAPRDARRARASELDADEQLRATAAFLGWPVRTFEAAVPPEKLGFGWAGFAFGGWKKLSALDEAVMRRVVPRKFFYNLAITGIKPE